jgi:NO-binding membrane sensor protein with MHYT domain/CheY-like chemotaxis protein
MISETFNPVLVTISIVIACLASYSALDLAGRVAVARERNRLTWLLYGSIAMGLGIWSMHFVGMLAFQMSIAVKYDVLLVLASALIAIAAAFLALYTVSGQDLPVSRLLIASVMLGAAISGMHYTGMAAMRMPATIHYSPLPFCLSIGIAVSASYVALWLAFRYRHDDTLLRHWRRGLSAFVMGLAIAGMHYVGMSAAHFSPSALIVDPFSYTISTGSWVTTSVIAGPVLVLVLALIGSSVDRSQTLAEYARLRAMRDEMEATVTRRTSELRTALLAAEKANDAKSQFLAHMSHELRTPLNSVIGFADILQKNKTKNLRPQDLMYIERIGANGRHLLSLINSVLDLAKVESGHMEIDLTQFSIAALIEDVVGALGGARDDRRVPLRVDVPPNLAPILSDAAKMRQILVNLIGNADKFTQRGSITIRVLADDDSPTPRRIDVIDTGVGIPPDRIDAVFRPFEQADTSTSRKYGGTGLGLPITLAMCELVGASLSVTSVVGEGSIFSVVLPPDAAVLDPKAEYPVSVADSLDTIDRECSRDALVAVLKRHSRSTPTRVLIVEDQPDAQQLLLHHLRNEENVETRIADSGITALQVLATFMPDLIMLDVRMPKMNGIVFLEHMRNDPLYAHIPVVVVTGMELTVAERAELMAATLGIIGKDDDLEHAVRRALVAVEARLTEETVLT